MAGPIHAMRAVRSASGHRKATVHTGTECVTRHTPSIPYLGDDDGRFSTYLNMRTP
jgi:hypothetical protein